MNTRAVATKDRPLGSQVPVQTQMENARRWLKPLREIVIDVSTITAFASAIIGTTIIRVYLSNFSIPISPLDTFSGVSLQIFAFLFITILGTAVFLFLVPFCAPYLVPPETRESLQELFGRRNIPPDTLRPALRLTRGALLNFCKEYTMFYLPTLFLIWSMPIVYYFEVRIRMLLLVVVLSLIIAEVLLYNKLKGRPKSESLSALLWLNLMTIVWMLVVEVSMLKAWEYAVSKSIVPMWKAALEVIGVSLLVTLCHIAMAWPRVLIRQLVGAGGVLLVGFYVYPGYAAIGAAALRVAWLGGGTRISYTVVGPRATTSEPTSGCLVLATTSYVLIGELDDNICPSLRRFSITGSEVKPRSVREFSRSEINISEVRGE
jgi:hypothetical protein